MAEPTLLTRDRPGMWWFLAFLLLTLAGCLLYIALFKSGEVEPWVAGLTGVMGVAGIAASGWLASTAPISTVLWDRGTNELIVTRVGITGRQERRFPVTDVARITIQRAEDSEGAPTSRPAFILKDGTTVPISRLWRHGDVDTDRAISQISAAIPRLKPPATRVS